MRPIRPPQPRPSPNPGQPVPGKATPKPTPEKALPEISWNESAPCVEVTDELKKKKPNFYIEFEGMAKYEADKPAVVFVYWPETDDGTADRKDRKKAEKSKLLEEMLKAECLREMADKFVWVRVNGRELKKDIAKRHGMLRVPCIVLIDIRGKKWYSLTSHRTKPEKFLKTLKRFEKFNERLRRIINK